jgi:hypothetical protein
MSADSTAATKPLPSKSFSFESFADFLGVAPLTIRREIDRKKLKATHIGRRVVITPANAEAYLKANEVA